LSVNTIQKIEGGHRHSPEIFTIAKIARAVGLSLDQLMGEVLDE